MDRNLKMTLCSDHGAFLAKDGAINVFMSNDNVKNP